MFARGVPAKLTVECPFTPVGVIAAVCVIEPEPSAFVPVIVILQLVAVNVKLGEEPVTVAAHKSTLMR